MRGCLFEIRDLVHQRHATNIPAVADRLGDIGGVHHQSDVVVLQAVHDVGAAFVDFVDRGRGQALLGKPESGVFGIKGFGAEYFVGAG